MTINSIDERLVPGWRQAFRLLASMELQRPCEWSGPDDLTELQLRVETLALLLDLVPRVELGRLPEVVMHLAESYSESVIPDIKRVRSSTRKLLARSADPPTGQDPHFRRAAAAIARPQMSLAARLEPQAGLERNFAQEYELCRVGIGTWFTQLACHPKWTHLRLLASDEAELPIETAFVDVFTVPDEDVETSIEGETQRIRRIAGRFTGETHAVMDAITMLNRTTNYCIVVGDPGSGKSTLVQWLAWSVATGKVADFDVPLVVKLGPFALALSESPELTLLDFFFDALGTKVDDWSGAVNWLREAAREDARYLLLLDGWDEVPPAIRDDVQRRIEQERPWFTTVVTSRPAGFPRRLATGGRAEVYHIAGLTREGQRVLAERYLCALKRKALLPDFLQHIETNRDLWELSCNPFLLGLLTWAVASRRVQLSHEWKPAELYRLVVAWMIDAASEREPELAGQLARSLDGLERISFTMLFHDPLPRYVFSADLLHRELDGVQTNAVIHSRLVSRLDLLGSFFAFVHATFQEYFAARHSESLGESELSSLLERSFLSVSRGIVLDFLIGLNSAAGDTCRAMLVQWMQQRDRYGQIVFRVARLLAACPLPLRPPQLVETVCVLLWKHITGTRDLETQQFGVGLFARLDPFHLCRSIRAEASPDQFVLDCIVANIPAAVGRSERIAELMDPALRERVEAELWGGPTAAAYANNRGILANPASSEEQLRQAILFAGAARDAEAVPSLEIRLRSPTLPDGLKEEISTSLGLIGGADAARVLVDLVVGNISAESVTVGLARRSLQHIEGGRLRLNPAGRDALLRRIACIRIETPRQVMLLSALQGFPIRTGTKLLKHLAFSVGVPKAIRFECLQVLEATLPDEELDELLERIVEEKTDIEALLLATAIQRRRRIPIPWLAQRLRASARLPDKTMLLSAALVMASNQEHRSAELEELLAETVRDALSSETPRHLDLAGAFRSALRDLPADPTRSSAWIDGELCRQVLRGFLRQDADIAADRVMLAATLLGRVPERESAVTLLQGLHHVRARLASPLHEMQSKLLDEVSRAMAWALAELHPGSLLLFPAAWQPVRDVLHSLSNRRGWLVFDDRILDSEGQPLRVPWEQQSPRSGQTNAMMRETVDGNSTAGQQGPRMVSAESTAFYPGDASFASNSDTGVWKGKLLANPAPGVEIPYAMASKFFQVALWYEKLAPTSQKKVAKKMRFHPTTIMRWVDEMQALLTKKFPNWTACSLLNQPKAGGPKTELSPEGLEALRFCEFCHPSLRDIRRQFLIDNDLGIPTVEA